MAGAWYHLGLTRVMQKKVDLATSPSIKVDLMTKAYTPDVDSDFWSDISANVTTASAYVVKTLGASTLTVTDDSTDDYAEWDYGADLIWTALGGNTDSSIQYAVLSWDRNAAAASQLLLCYLDFSGGIASTNGGNFTLAFNATGIGYLDTTPP